MQGSAQTLNWVVTRKVPNCSLECVAQTDVRQDGADSNRNSVKRNTYPSQYSPTSEWAESWWYIFDHSLAFESLRDDPRFQALRARVAADVAEQLAKVNKKESQSFMN